MRNLDTAKADLRVNLQNALKSEDENELVEAMLGMAEGLETAFKADMELYKMTQDDEILVKRGIKKLTSEEKTYFQAFKDAIASKKTMMQVAGIENALPTTIINSVFDDIKTEFPLLSLVDMQQVPINVKMIVDNSATAIAEWGPLKSEITKEIAASLIPEDVTSNKLAAYILVSMDMVRADVEWLAAYVHATLVESIGNAKVQAIIDGDGNKKPIGMTRNSGPDVTVTAGVYPRKTPIVITDFSVATIGNILATLATTPAGKDRNVENVVMVVSPADYFRRIFPAITTRNADGQYVQTLPYPMTILPQIGIKQGEAVIGLAKRYFLGVGYGEGTGMIEQSDDAFFTDDVRAYKAINHADGRPKDDNAFVLLDISGLETVNTINSAGTPVAPINDGLMLTAGLDMDTLVVAITEAATKAAVAAITESQATTPVTEPTPAEPSSSTKTSNK